MSTAFGQDLQSSAIQLGKALNDPVAGIGALQRIGVQFTEAQKNTIKALMGDNKQLEQMAKLASKASGSLPKLKGELAVATLKLQEMTASGKASESSLLAQTNKIEELRSKISDAEETLQDYKDAQNIANDGTSQSEKLLKAQKMILEEVNKETGKSARLQGRHSRASSRFCRTLSATSKKRSAISCYRR